MAKKVESYLRNNMISMRPQDGGRGIFEVVPDVGVFCRLDGYAIVPLEDYQALKEQAGRAVPKWVLETILEFTNHAQQA